MSGVALPIAEAACLDEAAVAIEDTASKAAAAHPVPDEEEEEARGRPMVVQRWDRFHPLFECLKRDLLGAASWDFAPYAPLSVETVATIHFLWVATAAVTSSLDHVAMRDVAGVVGAVLCPVGPSGTGTDVYLQVVLVRPRFRRRGVAAHMLRAMLQDLSHHARSRDDTAGSFPVLHRVRLHTMCDTPATETFLLKSSAAAAATTDGDAATTGATTPLAPQRVVVAGRLELLRSVRRMYEGLGFSVRRNCPGYYSKWADGVEMVLERAALLRNFPTQGEACRKRGRV